MNVYYIIIKPQITTNHYINTGISFAELTVGSVDGSVVRVMFRTSFTVTFRKMVLGSLRFTHTTVRFAVTLSATDCAMIHYFLRFVVFQHKHSEYRQLRRKKPAEPAAENKQGCAAHVRLFTFQAATSRRRRV